MAAKRQRKPPEPEPLTAEEKARIRANIRRSVSGNVRAAVRDGLAFAFPCPDASTSTLRTLADAGFVQTSRLYWTGEVDALDRARTVLAGVPPGHVSRWGESDWESDDS